MATVKGQNLRLFIDGYVLAAALSCELDVGLEVKQYSTKDDETDFANNEAVGLTWSIRAQAVVDDDVVSAIGADSIMDLIGQTVRARLNTTSGTQNREAGDILVEGDAILSDVQITAQNRQRTTYDITLTGRKNMLFDIRAIITANTHYIKTADGHIVCAAHES